MDYCNEDIRIGTMVSGNGDDPAGYIKQILPRGFESFQITFWQTTEGIDFQKLADEVNAALDGSGAIISSLGVFGNPLVTEEIDLQSLKGFERSLIMRIYSIAISSRVSPGAFVAKPFMNPSPALLKSGQNCQNAARIGGCVLPLKIVIWAAHGARAIGISRTIRLHGK